MTGDVTGEVSSNTLVNSGTKRKTLSVFFHKFDADHLLYNSYILFKIYLEQISYYNRVSCLK